MVPVSVQGGRDASLGNRVAPAFVDLPVGAMGPKRRLAIVREGTRHLKDSMMAMSADTIIGLGAYAPGGSARRRRPSREPRPVVQPRRLEHPGPAAADVPGRCAAGREYPSMPLGENSALSIACTSLGGTMAFGLTGDWDGMPDIQRLAFALEESVAELSKAAGV